MQNRRITVENFQKTVADFSDIKVHMYSKRLPANIARDKCGAAQSQGERRWA